MSILISTEKPSLDRILWSLRVSFFTPLLLLRSTSGLKFSTDTINALFLTLLLAVKGYLKKTWFSLLSNAEIQCNQSALKICLYSRLWALPLFRSHYGECLWAIPSLLITQLHILLSANFKGNKTCRCFYAFTLAKICEEAGSNISTEVRDRK